MTCAILPTAWSMRWCAPTADQVAAHRLRKVSAQPEARAVLAVAYYFPPATMVGARRSAKFARYLPACGYRFGVITTGAFGVGEEPLQTTVFRSPDIAGMVRRNVLQGASDVGA